MPEHTRDLALVFAGGNAVGAYHAGTYEALHSHRLRPDWVVGASIGAVTAAIIAGNAPEDRIAKLRAFWNEATLLTGPSPTGLRYSWSCRLRRGPRGRRWSGSQWPLRPSGRG